VLALLGRSGSGKSTLLNLIGGIDVPERGLVGLQGVELTRLGDRDRTLVRRRRIGFVYQFFNLLPTLTASENVALVLELNGRSHAESRERALAMLAALGLEACGERYPDQLSGGEQQRVAIARAMVHGPDLVLADEPTGNLDAATGYRVLELLSAMAAEHGAGLVVATHSREVAEWAHRLLVLEDGVIAAGGDQSR
jgi:putative ABC transport system ATP-binding protein